MRFGSHGRRGCAVAGWGGPSRKVHTLRVWDIRTEIGLKLRARAIGWTGILGFRERLFLSLALRVFSSGHTSAVQSMPTESSRHVRNPVHDPRPGHRPAGRVGLARPRAGHSLRGAGVPDAFLPAARAGRACTRKGTCAWRLGAGAGSGHSRHADRRRRGLGRFRRAQVSRRVPAPGPDRGRRSPVRGGGRAGAGLHHPPDGADGGRQPAGADRASGFRRDRPRDASRAPHAAADEPLGRSRVTPPAVSLGDLPGGPWVWSGLLVAALLLVALRSGAGPAALFGAAALGALVPAAWVGTGFVLLDEFDPTRARGPVPSPRHGPRRCSGPWPRA